MIRLGALATLSAALVLAGCNSNTSPGNDKESLVDPAPSPAPVVPAAAALSGIAVSAIQVETMSGADLARLGGLDGKCSIRLTTVGFPSFVRDAAGREGAIKLNGKLIPLRSAGDDLYRDAGLQVVLRPLERDFDADGRREAEMIVMLPGAKDELGYRGFEQCARPAGGRESGR